MQKDINKPNHLKDLLLLFGVPIAIAVFSALVIYTPRLLANPEYDFIYAHCPDYGCANTFSVDGSGSITEQSTSRDYYRGNMELYYYDVKKDSSKRLDRYQARGYDLDTSSKSPDGYAFIRETSSGGFLFWDEQNDGWYLKNGAKKKRIDLGINDSYYSSEIKFLGWVKK